MGCWGYGSFDNDDACDWVYELEVAEDIGPVSEALALALEADYLDAFHACRGIAAAEVVAALMGNPAGNLPEEVKAWVVGKEPPEPALIEKARRAVTRILEDSELRELWDEVQDEERMRWQQEVEDLLRRLGST